MITWTATDTVTGHRIGTGAHTDRTGALLDAATELRTYLVAAGAGHRHRLAWIVTLDGDLAMAGAAAPTGSGRADITAALAHLDLTIDQLAGHTTLHPGP